VELPLRFFDGHIVDASIATLHESTSLKLPVFVSVRPEPVPCIVVPLIRISNGDAIAVVGPKFFDESVVELFLPLPVEECLSFSTAICELRAVAPLRVERVGQGNLGRIASVPTIFGKSDFLDGSFLGKWGKGWACFHDATFVTDVDRLVYLANNNKSRTTCLQ
jgi:hypothetical protein